MLQSLLTIILNLLRKAPKSLPKEEPKVVQNVEKSMQENIAVVKEKHPVKISTEGKKLILAHEGFRSKPYLCPAGIPTIGYGNTYYEDGKKVTLNDSSITKERAEQLFDIIVSGFEDGVNRLVKVPLNQNQFDALVSFAYNVGLDENKNGKAEGLGDSTLLRLLNQGDYAGAANEFPKWCKDNGKVISGLIRRRKEEQQLFLKTV